MDFLNSRALTYQDGYLHSFRDAGEFTYGAAVQDYDEPSGGTISVAASDTRPGDGEQHDIVFEWDAKEMRFLPRDKDRSLKIRQNDFVLFQFETPAPGQPPCCILGRGEQETAHSAQSVLVSGSHPATHASPPRS